MLKRRASLINDVSIVTPVTYSQIVFASIHYGLGIRELNPFYSFLVYSKFYGKVIYDVRYTLFNLKRGIFVFSNLIFYRGKFLFIDNFRENYLFDLSIFDEYNLFLNHFLYLNQFFINSRWISGFLTNFKYIIFELNLFLSLLKKKVLYPNDFNFLKIEFCTGIKKLKSLPSFCFLNTINRLPWQTFEVANLKLPSIVMSGSSSNNIGFFFPVFGNADSIFSIFFMIDLFYSIIVGGYFDELCFFFSNIYLYYKRKLGKIRRSFKLKRYFLKLRKKMRRKFFIRRYNLNKKFKFRNKKKSYKYKNLYKRKLN